MNLKEKIRTELNSALKSKDEIAVLTLRQLLAMIVNKEKEKKYKLKEEKEVELTDDEVLEVIASEVKKRREAMVEFEKGKRSDLVEKEKKELAILEKYLPQQLSAEEIRNLAEAAIKKIKAQGIKDLGKVMAELMPQVKGRSDGKMVSQIVKELLIP
ncbi:MAG: GatB/YqeY domain-containing protein [Minisyncoccales bacterium]